MFFIRDVDRVSVYDVLGRLRGRRNSVFPSLVDPVMKEAVVEHEARGRLLGKACIWKNPVEYIVQCSSYSNHSAIDNPLLYRLL